MRIAILAFAAWLVWYTAGHWDRWTGEARFETTDDAFVSGDVTPLSARVSGNIIEMPVNDFERVHKDQLLAVIDPSDYQARLELAEANVAAAQATLANLANQRRGSGVACPSSPGDHRGGGGRRPALRARGQAPARPLADRPRRNPPGGRAGGRQYEEGARHPTTERGALDQQKAALAAIDVQEKQVRAQIRAAEAQVALADDDLRYTRIVSPAPGIVGQRQVRLGQFVNVGTQVIAVVPLPDIWVTANFKETQMTNMRAGQSAIVTVDAFPDLKLIGRVENWSPGTGSTFALLPPDNATGNFTKVVQRVPVKIVLDKNPSLGSLVRPGMSVEATVDTRTSSGAEAEAQP